MVKKYPLQREMSLDEIKAVPREDVFNAAMEIAEGIGKDYDGTQWHVDLPLARKLLMFITLVKHTGGSLGGTFFRLLPFQAEFECRSCV